MRAARWAVVVAAVCLAVAPFVVCGCARDVPKAQPGRRAPMARRARTPAGRAVGAGDRGGQRASQTVDGGDSVIVVGKRIGPLALGMTAEEAERVGTEAWGEKPSVERRGGVVLYWEKAGVRANAFGPKGGPTKVEILMASNRRFRTREGIGVGASYSAAKRALGEPVDYFEVPGAGASATWRSRVEVELDTEGIITSIEIASAL